MKQEYVCNVFASVYYRNYPLHFRFLIPDDFIDHLVRYVTNFSFYFLSYCKIALVYNFSFMMVGYMMAEVKQSDVLFLQPLGS